MWIWLALGGCPYITDAMWDQRIAAYRLSGAVELDDADAVIGGVANTAATGAQLAAVDLGDLGRGLAVSAVGNIAGDTEYTGVVMVMTEVAPGGRRLDAAPGSVGWLTAEAPDDGAGWSIAAIGSALLVGAPFADMPEGPGPGVVYQMPLATLRDDADAVVPLAEAPGRVRGVANNAAGFGVAAFDATRDGVVDAIASAPFSAILGGRVVAWSGGLEEQDPVPDVNIEGDVGFGYDLDAADVDGDGNVDLIASNALDNGVVYVFTEALADGQTIDDATATIVGAEGDALGYALAHGDVDGDGLDDIVAGAPGANDVGRAYVFTNPTSGEADQQATGWIAGTDVGDQAGFAVSAGDMDRDGTAELLVGAPAHRSFTGRAALCYGPHRQQLTMLDCALVVDGQNREGATGYAVLLADIGDDDHLDVLIGAPNESLAPGDDYTGAVGVFFGVGR